VVEPDRRTTSIGETDVFVRSGHIDRAKAEAVELIEQRRIGGSDVGLDEPARSGPSQDEEGIVWFDPQLATAWNEKVVTV
jgi:hypothetical protein